MIELIQGWWLSFLPSIFLKVPLWTVLSVIIPVTVLAAIGWSLLVDGEWKYLGGGCLSVAVMLFGLLTITPNTQSISNLAETYPEHQDSRRYKAAIESQNIKMVETLNSKWKEHKKLDDLLVLWQATNMLPRQHPIREEYLQLTQYGVMSKDDYQKLLVKIISQNVDNAEQIAAVLGKANRTL